MAAKFAPIHNDKLNGHENWYSRCWCYLPMAQQLNQLVLILVLFGFGLGALNLWLTDDFGTLDSLAANEGTIEKKESLTHLSRWTFRSRAPAQKACLRELTDFIPLKDFFSHNEAWIQERFRKVQNRSSVQIGGIFSPETCGQTASSRTAILVPYRSRRENLIRFLAYMHSFLSRQLIVYQIFIISQDEADGMAFNRGMLLNIGFVMAMNGSTPWDCLILHDVDHLPEAEDNLYTCGSIPRHMNSNVDNHGKPIYPLYFGGVSAITPTQYKSANGFSNQYFGWGGEDDDFLTRLNSSGMSFVHNSQELGRYSTLKHPTQKPNMDRFKLLRKSLMAKPYDGLSNLKFKLLSIATEQLYTNITVSLYKDFTIPRLSKLNLRKRHQFSSLNLANADLGRPI